MNIFKNFTSDLNKAKAAVNRLTSAPAVTQPPAVIDNPSPTPDTSTQPQPPAQDTSTQQGQALQKKYQDMYDREAKRVQAQQAQNLTNARLNAQQTAALAGYSPDMAERAMFEQTAGAYDANQNIENELAKYGLDVDEKMYKRFLENGYNYNPETGEYTFTPPWEKEAQAQQGSYDYWKKQAEQGNLYAKEYLAYLDSQLGQARIANSETNKENEGYSLATSLKGMSKADIQNITVDDLRKALTSEKAGAEALVALKQAGIPQYSSARTKSKSVVNQVLSAGYKVGDIVIVDGVPIKLTQAPYRSKTGGGKWDYHTRVRANLIGVSLIDGSSVATAVSYIT